MHRIVVFGGTGSGKSTFARALGERLGLPVIHLDALYYEPGWRDPDPRKFQARLASAIAGESWISEGNFVALTADLRLPRADMIFWIEQPVWLRMARALRRGFFERGERPDLAPGCRDRVNWELLSDVWAFDRKWRPMIEAAIGRHSPRTPLIRLRGNGAVADFLASLTPVLAAHPAQMRTSPP